MLTEIWPLCKITVQVWTILIGPGNVEHDICLWFWGLLDVIPILTIVPYVLLSWRCSPCLSRSRHNSGLTGKPQDDLRIPKLPKSAAASYHTVVNDIFADFIQFWSLSSIQFIQAILTARSCCFARSPRSTL